MPIRSKLSIATLMLATGALAACEGGLAPFGAPSRGAAFTPVTTEAEFRAAVVGREVVYANGAVGSYGEDGTWSVTDGSGVIGGGTWTWTDERWCSEGSTVDGPVAPACDAVAVSNGAVRFTREDGTVGTLPFRG
jgi:hypothetical protein